MQWIKLVHVASWIFTLALATSLAGAQQTMPVPITAEIIAASVPSDWRPLDSENTLYIKLGSGRVVVELAPSFAPRHVANVKALAREKFYDGRTIYRVQDNYVVQGGEAETRVDHESAPRGIQAEFTRKHIAALPFEPLPDRDGYALETGFSNGFPAARNRATDEAWLVHCYGAFGMPRDNDPDSGGTDFYVVIGHAPRHLDRNTTVFGRVVKGMERLSTLPRGTEELGFYKTPQERQPIRSVRVAADLPEAQRERLEILRTDTDTFRQLIEARRNRREEWFHFHAGYVEVCNVPVPVRESAQK
jgi:peptidylprolyl isomerase